MAAMADGSNIFEDMGVPNPEEALLKAYLVVRIKQVMRTEGLTHERTAERMGIYRSDLTRLLKGEHRGFSLDRLFRGIKGLGQNIEVRIGPKSAEEASAHLSVVMEPLTVRPADDDGMRLSGVDESSLLGQLAGVKGGQAPDE